MNVSRTSSSGGAVDTPRVLVFLGFAFGLAWLTALVIHMTGGIDGSPHLAPGLTLALLLLATAYMWAPAIANILTRVLTREGWKSSGLRLRARENWKLYLAAWILPAAATLSGAALFFVLFPRSFAPQPWLPLTLKLAAGALLGPLANAFSTFGEELGWRGYLLPKLIPLGGRKAMLMMGAIWGVWHWPAIFMGYEYGFQYPGAPWAGPLLFVWIVFLFGTFLGWLYLRSESVWPAVIGHGGINAMGAASLLTTTGHPNPLLGPTSVGIVGSLGFAVLALILFATPRALEARTTDQSTSTQMS
ncbi:MAG: CPBP family intramembrane glutamic endopeptidase [Polyangiaceae bacterium]